MLAYQLLSALALTVAAFARGATAQVVYTYAYANSVQCSGPYVACASYAGHCCGNYPLGYGYSVYVSSLPTGSEIEGFRSGGCAGGVFAVFGPGSYCTTSGGLWRTVTSKWQYSRKTAAVEASAATPDDQCISPTVFGYETDKGVQREINIPIGVANATDTVAALYLAKDFEALAKYETHHRNGKVAEGKPASDCFTPTMTDG